MQSRDFTVTPGHPPPMYPQSAYGQCGSSYGQQPDTAQAAASAPYNYYDAERSAGGGDTEFYMDDVKTERIVRHGFIRKVYGIVTAQLATTFLFAVCFMFVKPMREWAQFSSFPVVILASVGTLVVVCYLMCAAGASQNYPTNYILLGIFTLLESLLVGILTTFYDVIIVTQAFFATSVIVLGLTLFAFQTRYDFTSWMGVMFYILLGCVAFGLLRIIFWQSRTMDLIYSSIMAFVFSIYLVIDTQLLIGRGKIRLTEDDYILAALMIYLDVINLFIYILQIINDLRRN